MSLLAWIIVGGLAGWIASLLMNTSAEQGLVSNIIVGVLGALVGGLIFTSLGFGGIAGFSLYSLFVSVIGAVVLIGIYKAVARS